VEVVSSLSQGRTAAAQCGLFTYKSVPVIFEPPCNSPHFMEPEPSLPHSKCPTGPRLLQTFRNRIRFYAEELLAHRPNPKLEDQTLSAVSDCLFNIFAATLHIGCRSSVRNLRTRHAVVTETHLSRNEPYYIPPK